MGPGIRTPFASNSAMKLQASMPKPYMSGLAGHFSGKSNSCQLAMCTDGDEDKRSREYIRSINRHTFPNSRYPSECLHCMSFLFILYPLRMTLTVPPSEPID